MFQRDLKTVGATTCAKCKEEYPILGPDTAAFVPHRTACISWNFKEEITSRFKKKN